MSGKILIYGASGAIGAEIARRLHRQGKALHLVGRDNGRLAAIAEETGASSTQGDVLDETLFDRAASDAGVPLSGLVYAVGTITLKSLSRLSSEEFITDYRVNALGAAHAVRTAVPALKRAENGASIVLFSSVAVQQGFAFHSSIGMAKGAVEGLTRSLAAELSPRVRVNAIAPSLTRSNMAAPLLSSSASAENIAGMHPLPRLGEPADMAALATFLLSEDASWMTGQIVGVDGGRSSLRVKG